MFKCMSGFEKAIFITVSFGHFVVTVLIGIIVYTMIQDNILSAIPAICFLLIWLGLYFYFIYLTFKIEKESKNPEVIV